jgi:hypothetical protein
MLFSVGDRVSAKYQDGRYYPGKVIRVITSGKCYRIHFNDGDKATVTARNVRVRRMAGRRKQQPKFASKKDLESLRAELVQIGNTINAQLEAVFSRMFKLEEGIEANSKNIAKLWAKNATQPNEKSSGTRRSRAGPISDQGVIGLPLPGGAADSNAR